jgi:hypothetical protein
MTILDDLLVEAEYLRRQESNLAQMIKQHRKSAFDTLRGRPPAEDVRELIKILGITDFRGYFRDQK